MARRVPQLRPPAATPVRHSSVASLDITPNPATAGRPRYLHRPSRRESSSGLPKASARLCCAKRSCSRSGRRRSHGPGFGPKAVAWRERSVAGRGQTPSHLCRERERGLSGSVGFAVTTSSLRIAQSTASRASEECLTDSIRLTTSVQPQAEFNDCRRGRRLRLQDKTAGRGGRSHRLPAATPVRRCGYRVRITESTSRRYSARGGNPTRRRRSSTPAESAIGSSTHWPFRNESWVP